MISELANLYAKVNEMKSQQEHDKNRITYVNQLVIDLEKKFERLFEDHKKRLLDLTSRVEKLERKSILPTEKRLTEILREQLNGHDVTITFDPGMKEETAYMAIRCPRKHDMSAKDAIEYLFYGSKISRRKWANEDAYIKIGDSKCLDIEPEDLLANDWYIV